MNIKSIISTLVFTSLTVGVALHAREGESHKNRNTNSNKSLKSSAAACAPATAVGRLNFNNVSARIENGGVLWMNRSNSTPDYEVPKGSGKNAIFAGGLWLGGLSPNGTLKLAGVTFRADGDNFWPGPLTLDGTASVDASICNKYDRLYSAFKSDAQRHQAYFQAVENNTVDIQFPDGYSRPSYFDEWPSDERNAGYDPILAPFVDFPSDGNTEGVYEPELGDYPGYDLSGEVNCRNATRDVPLFGDTTIFWIMNDKGNIHQDPEAEPIGMEIRAQAFAFADEGPINNMTFYNYVLINRGGQTLQNTYFGQYMDVDLGFPADDYVGCDVQRGLGFVYNGDEDDNVTGGSPGYGLNPPALGVDFFQGPFQDRDIDSTSIPWEFLNQQYGVVKGDNPGPYDKEFAPAGIDPSELDFNVATLGKGIPYRGIGIGYGDSIPDNERFGMRRFVYWNIGSGLNQDPTTASDYYNYLRGQWKDQSPMYYGGDGFKTGVDRTIKAKYMFPGNSDPVGFGTGGVTDAPEWSEVTAGNNPQDRRFLQSAGPFTLEPGDINNVTVGLVYARAEAGGRLASVAKMKEADDIAQGLFDDCFQVFEGPDAPNITLTELDREIILQLDNPVTSNNANEAYASIKRDISEFRIETTSNTYDVDEVSGDTTLIPGTTDTIFHDRVYRFEGYKVYQLKDATVGPSDLGSVDKAKLIAQVDRKNFTGEDNDVPIADLVNYTIDAESGIAFPEIMVNGANNGIKRAFRITDDAFAEGADKRLVNNKTYYFMAVAYAYNNFLDYDPVKSEGQATQYVVSRKDGFGGAISPVAGIPHKLDAQTGGTRVNSQFGDEIAITRLEGIGNDSKFVELTEETEERILNSPDFYTQRLDYKEGAGPFTIKVVDPLKMVNNDFRISFDGKWRNDREDKVDSVRWLLTSKFPNPNTGKIDSIYSDQTIDLGGEQLIPELGFSIEIRNINPEEVGSTSYSDMGTELVGAEQVYADPLVDWLSWLPDADGITPLNWIRSGGNLAPSSNETVPYEDRRAFPDPTEQWETVLGGGWAPFGYFDDSLAGFINQDAPRNRYGVTGSAGDLRVAYTPNVDVVITNDKSKWSRVPVIEASFSNDLSDGDAIRGYLRDAASVDKNGNPFDWQAAGFNSIDEVPPSTNENDPHFVSAKGMGWFPGYAIDVISGERLNMAFSEDSYLKSENGADMLWNPTSRISTNINDGTNPIAYLFGGKHVIVVFKNQFRVNENQTFRNNNSTYEYDNADIEENYVGAYDHGVKAMEGFTDTVGAGRQFRDMIRSMGWVGYPLVNPSYVTRDGQLEIPTETRIKLRVAKRFEPYVPGNDITQTLGDSAFLFDNSENRFAPLYEFTTDGKAPEFNVTQLVKDNLPNIRVVPNPYYAYVDDAYETSRLDNRVRITNLPREVKVNIYTIEGTLVRTFSKNNDSNSYIEWDLKNDANIPISSGIYYIHVEVPGVGEQIIKWMGVMRKVDLQNL